MYTQQAQELKKILETSTHARIVSHRNPDGDAIGSILAFAEICKFFKISYDLFLIDPIPNELQFLDRDNQIQLFDEKHAEDFLNNEKTDLVVFLDCGQINRAGIFCELILPHQKTINIDHHISNPNFADYNLVGDISSTCELLYNLALSLHVPITYAMAEPIYVGMLTDTGRFQFDKVTAETFHVAGELVKQGVSPYEIFGYVYQSQPISWLKLLRIALENIELYHDDQLAILPFSLLDLEESEFTETNIILPVLGNTQSIQVYAILKEKEDGTISASLRSKTNAIDVAQIASVFGGGGHQKAAGCRSSDHTLLEFKDMIRYEIIKHL